jgi:hypothetical protein
MSLYGMTRDVVKSPEYDYYDTASFLLWTLHMDSLPDRNIRHMSFTAQAPSARRQSARLVKLDVARKG